ncbi:hypothetical protein [Actinokineospora cianjurensis]|uniref:hypothetical protein n=1 Tax=Actinokineospora cianjurensis TaxID=585224 RepID=UPI001FE57E9A|nr:hypothetical protein [Actinokineospora cianjurensis]
MSPTRLVAVGDQATQRHAPHDSQLLRYRDGEPISHRRLDYLYGRVRKHHLWADSTGVSAH